MICAPMHQLLPCGLSDCLKSCCHCLSSDLGSIKLALNDGPCSIADLFISQNRISNIIKLYVVGLRRGLFVHIWVHRDVTKELYH